MKVGENVFTGIIEEKGVVKSITNGSTSAVLTIGCKRVLKGTKLGDSIAVNGVCLTVTSMGSDYYTADIMHETLNRSSLGGLKAGSIVNLERAMAADGRFGGHIVSGHIDSTGNILNIEEDDNAIWYHIGAKPDTVKYIVEKGSIAIDGISLTVAAVDNTSFKVSTIPHTRKETNLSERKIGDIVNLECDIIGKYVEKLMGFNNEKKNDSKLTEKFLLENGFI